ncbi:MAG: SpoIID/LytB domain-containing protein [Caldicoprobacterales bacterium]|jgi:stage II sporulation protein D|nr:SpoIID/LytB domain-containing protein [Clostridiales bacterium]
MKHKALQRKILFTFLTLLVTAAAGAPLLIRLFHPPQKRLANQFFQAVSAQRNYDEYLLNHLNNHSFPDYLIQEEIIQFDIERVESSGKNESRVWVSAPFHTGNVQFYLDMIKYNQEWKISRLPEMVFHTHGIPTSASKSEGSLMHSIIQTGEDSLELSAPSTADINIGQPISFTTLDGVLIDFQPLQPVKLTKILSLSNTTLEDKELGYFDIQGEFPVFVEDGHSIQFKGCFFLPIGVTQAVLYQTADQIGRMAVLTHPFENYDSIRVLLKNSDYTSSLHNKLEITSQYDFEVFSLPSGIQIPFESNQTAEFRPSEHGIEVWKNGDLLSASLFRWHIRSKTGQPLYVKTIYREQALPRMGTPYRGYLETAMMDGFLTLVNEVDLEEYLYSVVPSEMPVKFGLEALKVQAVAARAYAARAMQSPGYRAYGAHLDDSVASQVYNNISEQDVATHAVNETAGMVPVYSGHIVDTRFFSTSCGYTANFHEVWSNAENEFPSEEIPYLTAKAQYEGNVPDLDREENFRAFLDQTTLSGYDKFSPFFRWEVKMSRQQMEAILSYALPVLYEQQPVFILTKTADGSYESEEIPPDIGTLLNIEVLHRGEGGNMMELEISTTHGIFKITKEYNIRRALEPVNRLSEGPIELLCHDGSIRRDFPILPSAFAYIDYSRDAEGNVKEISIHGGGYGHGVGMSQYGAYGLTLLGKTWQDIILHYYPGSELSSLHQIGRGR